MTSGALVLGPLRADGYAIYRSAIRWLVPSGSSCRAGEVFAYCTLSLVADRSRPHLRTMFSDEELQVAFAPRVGGRVVAVGEARGGALRVRSVEVWDPDEIVAHLEDGSGTMPVRLLVLAAQRLNTLANNDVGLLSGWYVSRCRGIAPARPDHRPCTRDTGWQSRPGRICDRRRPRHQPGGQRGAKPDGRCRRSDKLSLGGAAPTGTGRGAPSRRLKCDPGH